jgi:PAS domain S-box-containing protein
MADAVVQVDVQDRILYWNRGACELFGHSTSQAIGRSLSELIVPEKLREKHLEGYARVMAGHSSKYGRRDLLRVPALTKDGDKISVEFTLLLTTDENGKPATSAAVMRDVTAMSNTVRRLREKIASLEKEARTV